MASTSLRIGAALTKKGRATGNQKMVQKGKAFERNAFSGGDEALTSIKKHAPDAYQYYTTHDAPAAAGLKAKRQEVTGRTDNVKTGNQGLGINDTTRRKKRLAGGGRTLLGRGGSKNKLGL